MTDMPKGIEYIDVEVGPVRTRPRAQWFIRSSQELLTASAHGYKISLLNDLGGGLCPGCQVPLVASCPVCGNPMVGEHIHPES